MRAKRNPGSSIQEDLAVRAYRTISIVIIRTATSVTVTMGLSKSLSIFESNSFQFSQACSNTLCRPSRPFAAIPIVTGADSAPAEDVPGFGPCQPSTTHTIV